MFIKKFLVSILILPFIWINTFEVKRAFGIIPFYSSPSENDLEKESLSIARSAYQMLYFGQIKEALNLAKLAITLNNNDEKIWAILAETQIANKLNKEALESLKRGKEINPQMSELHFAESSIYLTEKSYIKAKKAIKKGLKIQPDNATAIFQLGNIYLIELKYNEAIKMFTEAIDLKKDFWQALNNIGLSYFELDEFELSKKYFERALSFEKNAEPLLGLAASIQNEDQKRAISLTKEALYLDPKYVSKKYREEQLWGKKIQKATNKLFTIKELKKDINFAKQYLN